jgi:hypothetical protein
VACDQGSEYRSEQTAHVVSYYRWATTVTPVATGTNTPGSPIKVGRVPDPISITR